MQLHSNADYARLTHGAETLAHVDGNWHGFGKQLKADATVDELLDTAGINWTVKKEPIWYDRNGTQFAVPNKRALVREDGKAFDVVGKDWAPTQNRDLAEFADKFRRAGNLEWIGAGACGNGSKVFIQAKTTNGFKLFDGKDEVEQLISFYNPHKHGAAVVVGSSANRLWCANQVTGFGRDGRRAQARFHHVDGVKGFSEEAALKLLNATAEACEVFKSQAELLASKRASAAEVQSFLRGAFNLVDLKDGPPDLVEASRARNQRQLDKLLDAHHTQPGVQCGEGTWWQVFNTVTYYVDHVAGKDEAARTASALLGAGEARKVKALDLALAAAA